MVKHRQRETLTVAENIPLPARGAVWDQLAWSL